MDAKGKVTDWVNQIVECLDCGKVSTWSEFENDKVRSKKWNSQSTSAP